MVLYYTSMHVLRKTGWTNNSPCTCICYCTNACIIYVDHIYHQNVILINWICGLELVHVALSIHTK